MGIKTAPEVVVKTPTEQRFVNFDWSDSDDLASGETLSSVSGTPASTPTGLTVTQATVSGTLGQVKILDGTAEQAFTATASDDTFTATGHGLLDGWTVRLDVDGVNDLPGGTDNDTTYYVVGATANTFQLAKTSGGTAIDITDDGQGFIYVEYLVSFDVNTSAGQVLQAIGRCRVRTA